MLHQEASATNFSLHGDAPNQEYVESVYSAAFPMVPVEVLNQFLQQRQTANENIVIRAVREWVRGQQLAQG